MDYSVEYAITFGIPLFGALLCIIISWFLCRLGVTRRVHPVLAGLLYLPLAAIPFLFAYIAVKIGSELGNEQHNFVFYGEKTMGLLIMMLLYLVFAAIYGLAFITVMYRRLHASATFHSSSPNNI